MDDNTDRMDETIYNINLEPLSELDWDSYIAELFNGEKKA